MSNWQTRGVLFLTYFVFAILLNSVGAVILQVIKTYGVSHQSASVLEGFKDLPIAIVSFLVASFLPRVGFRRAMITGLAIVTLACISMPLMPSFLTTKLLFLATGVSFALVKVSVYSTLGLITDGPKAHASAMNMLEGTFMVGVLSGYAMFSMFVDDTNSASNSWLEVYWLLAGLCLTAIACLVLTPFDESKAQNEGATLKEDFLDMIKLATKPLGYVFAFSVFLYVLLEQGIGTWLPTFNNEVLNLPQSFSIQATGIFAASLALGRFAAGSIMARVSWYPVLNICIVGVGMLILVSLPLAAPTENPESVNWFNAPIAAYIFPLVGLFLAPIYPAINSAVLSALPAHQHSEMTGLIVVFSALGGTTGSMITGAVFGSFGGSVAFYLTLIPLLCLLLLLVKFNALTKNCQAF